jgi:hypothetical protein
MQRTMLRVAADRRIVELNRFVVGVAEPYARAFVVPFFPIA